MIEESGGVYRIKGRNGFKDGVAILLVLFGLMSAGIGVIENVMGMIAGGGAGIVIGALMFTVFKSTRSNIEINDKGFVERISGVSKGLIPWEEIDSVFVYDRDHPGTPGKQGGDGDAQGTAPAHAGTSTQGGGDNDAQGATSVHRTASAQGASPDPGAAPAQNKFIGITLKDIDAYKAKLNAVQKRVLDQAMGMGFAHINIPCTVIYDVEKFVSLCEERLRRHS